MATKKKASKKKTTKKKASKKKSKKKTTSKKKTRKKKAKKRTNKQNADKNPVGRPRLFNNPEEMDELINNYILMCQKARPPVPLTLTGMILSLGLSSRESFDHYQTYGEQFSDSVKRGKLFIENGYEIRLHGTTATGSIFALKNFGWRDKPEDEVKSDQDLADALAQLAGALPS